jgi:tetrapyrrole methylase family protein/MazG family protein
VDSRLRGNDEQCGVMNNFQKLLDIMAALRAENGCPWDREQTRESLTPYLVEETYEVIEAIEENSPQKIKEELGDLLFQIVFHCQLAKERGEFSMEDVIDAISEKMTGRHPHVFGDAKFETSEQVLKQWEERKKEEGKNRESILEGVPKELPSLLKAHRIQSRAARVGFDWSRVADVMDKLDEELSEFREALAQKDQAAIEDELGDVFFVLVNISRFVGVNPEDALRKTISKFISRFRYIEMKAANAGRKLSDMTLEEMDALWDEAKEVG